MLRSVGPTFGVAALILIAVCLILLAPLATLWALNTISEEAKLGWYIPHAVWTYIPIWVLAIFWRSSASSSSKS